jgi:uncharacterized protein (TIGR02391 family)
MNTAWAINELAEFVARAADHRETYDRDKGSPEANAKLDDVIGRMLIVEQIADRVWPEWRDSVNERKTNTHFTWEYGPLIRVAKQVTVLLERREELERNLGEAGPALSAVTMHPDVWEASKSLWRNGHFGEAVSAAAKSVNAGLQAKVGRRDASDTKLVSESFSLDAPKPGVPRLRLMHNDGSDTYKSMHEGAVAFGRGCFMGIRNVLAHEYGAPAEPPEDVALHYLAAFSVLARWIDDAQVER